MSEPTRPHSRKFLPPLLRFLVPAAIMAIVLTGCTAAPEAPVQTTQSAEKYRAGLEDFSRRMLDLGAPAVLIETRINGDVWSHAGGVRSLGSPAPAEASNSTHIASVTKSMVAVSVLKLVEEGHVQLQDPVTKHLPEFDSLVNPRGAVTVAHLLRHESGIPSYEEELFSSRPIRQALTQKLSLGESLRFRPLLVLAHAYQRRYRWHEDARLQEDALRLARSPAREALVRYEIGSRLFEEALYRDAAAELEWAHDLYCTAGRERLARVCHQALQRAREVLLTNGIADQRPVLST